MATPIRHCPPSRPSEDLTHNTFLRHLGVGTLIAVLCAMSAISEASPWIEPGNERTRHHIQSLSDGGLIRTPTTGWPLMWSNIKADLDRLVTQELTAGQLWSYHYLKHELRKAMRPSHLSLSTQIGNEITAISDFSTDAQERYQASVAFDYTGDRVAYRTKVSYAHNPEDGHTYRADGSYLNYLVGNWAVGIGLIDRWWGPGWESSLILSHNARPLPSLYLQRNLAVPFETPLLSWLGPWQLTTFMSMLESARAVPDASVWGARVSFKPFKRLDIGLSRMAQWGGKGQSNDIDTFVDLILSKSDNDNSEGRNQAQEHANQLAGIDWRLGYGFSGVSGSIYGQFVSESDAAISPSNGVGMAGVELNSLLGEIHMRLSLEAQNTTASFYDEEKRQGNETYEHPLYQSGYRYYGRPIGASTDNDSESVTLRSQWYFRSGRNLNLSVGRHRLNTDNSGRASPGGSTFGPEEQSTYKAQVNYTAPLNDVLLLQLSAFHYSESITYDEIELGSGGFATVRAYW